MVLIIEVLDRLPAEACGDAGAGNDAADPLPNLEVLGVHLGELIHIEASDHRSDRPGERVDRQLNEVVDVDQLVEELELQRMNEVLGIVHHDSRKLNVLLGLEHEDVGDRLVQAVGLAGRAIVRNQHHMDVLVQPLRLAHLGLGEGIIQVYADEVMRVLVSYEA